MSKIDSTLPISPLPPPSEPPKGFVSKWALKIAEGSKALWYRVWPHNKKAVQEQSATSKVAQVFQKNLPLVHDIAALCDAYKAGDEEKLYASLEEALNKNSGTRRQLADGIMERLGDRLPDFLSYALQEDARKTDLTAPLRGLSLGISLYTAYCTKEYEAAILNAAKNATTSDQFIQNFLTEAKTPLPLRKQLLAAARVLMEERKAPAVASTLEAFSLNVFTLRVICPTLLTTGNANSDKNMQALAQALQCEANAFNKNNNGIFKKLCDTLFP